MEGDGEVVISRIAPFEDCKPGDLVFADKKEYLPGIQRGKPTAVVTTPKLKELFRDLGLVVLTSPHVPLAHSFIKLKYADRNYAESGWSEVHPSAIIHPTAKIDKSAVIEPRVVVGANTVIGKNVRVQAGVTIENDVTIGDGTIIHPHVVIGYGSQIGKEVLIGPGTVIGSEGYGFAQDQNRRSYSIPQTGIVVIEDRVRLGANCCVDRATYGVTKIGEGTKMDNLCHVAHNVQIGKNCLLTAFLCVAGSSVIGDRVIASGQTGIIDHMTVANDVTLVHRAAVAQPVDQPGIYAGYPLLPLAEYVKNTIVLKNAIELKKRVVDLERKLGIKDSDQK